MIIINGIHKKSMLNKVCQFKKTTKLTNNGKENF